MTTVTIANNDVVNLALASRGSTITGSNGANWSKLIDGVTTGYTGDSGYGYTYWTDAPMPRHDDAGPEEPVHDIEHETAACGTWTAGTTDTRSRRPRQHDVDHDRGPDSGDEVSELAGHRLQPADPSAVLAADRHI